jgi:outer membrane receptor protein involved in Fe transport
LGVTVDPFGKGKTKAFYNFGRFFEFLAAERSLSSEKDFTGGHAAYGEDTWRVTKYITALLGLRWEQERITGALDLLDQ